ncbi:MAG TPA: 5-formyltetrahydrofolate cyclo-ligase [Stellaceae bacterium]|nr:5-formyltetrahydrofolate cyclo-ligase [Stellaceae bacterium]
MTSGNRGSGKERAEPPADLARWRGARRAALLAARSALDPAERERASRQIEAHLAGDFLSLAPRPFGFYWPSRSEFDPLPFVRRLIAAGSIVALPVVVERSRPLKFRRWQPGAAMMTGRYDIPIPAEEAEVLPQVLLVPLLGFDAAGYRLGYGGGYYDRTLAALSPPPLAIGVGFAIGRIETIHPQPQDIPMNAIVTEAGVLRRVGGILQPA